MVSRRRPREPGQLDNLGTNGLVRPDSIAEPSLPVIEQRDRLERAQPLQIEAA